METLEDMRVIVLHDVDGASTEGLDALAAALEAFAGTSVERPVRETMWWPGRSLYDFVNVSPGGVTALVGVGSGAQAALRTAYDFGREFPVVAAIAPACDLGRWYGRGTEIDEHYATSDAARQDEAPLFFNPLSRPMHQLCWCDPRDNACLPSALRVVSKVQSSGVTIEADLDTELGPSRDEYLRLRAGELARWVHDACDRAASSVELPVLPR